MVHTAAHARQTERAALRQRGREGIIQSREIRRQQQRIQEQRQEQLQELQKQQETEQKEIRKWERAISDFDKFRRGKSFFLGLNPSSERREAFDEIRKAIEGKESKVPPRIAEFARKTKRTSFSAEPGQLRRELQGQGVDFEALQKGELKIEQLQPRQLEALRERGLIRETQTQGSIASTGEEIIGSGARGGLLVQTASGEVEERFQTPSPTQTLLPPPKTDIEAFQREGLEPIVNRQGDVTGFRDTLNQQSISTEAIGSIEQARLQRLEDSGVIERVPSTRTGTIEPAVKSESLRELSELSARTLGGGEIGQFAQRQISNIDQFTRNVRDSIPELKFIPEGTLRNALRNAAAPFAVVGGTLSSFESALQKELSQLQDSSGRFVFNQEQSDRLGKLIAESSGGFGTGLAVGKGASLIRGGALAALPTRLKNNPRFQGIVAGLDLALLGTLGAVELNRISNTFKREGVDAALAELIGAVSFVRGFSRTGLKSDAASEREFRDLANRFKESATGLVRGRRGQVQLFRRRKKKKIRDPVTGELRDATPEELEALRLQAEAEIERLLANAASAEEQLRILGLLRQRIKTPQDKKRFNEYILRLFEKGVIRGQTVEISPGVTARVPTFRSPQERLATKPSRQRNIERVQQARTKNQRRITQAQKPLGQRFREAKTGVTRVATALSASGLALLRRQLNRTRQQLAQPQLSLERQRVLQRQLERRQIALRQQQRLIQRQRLQPRLQTSPQLRPERTRFTPRLRPRPPRRPPRIPPRLPKIPLPFGKKRKKAPLPITGKRNVRVFLKQSPSGKNQYAEFGRPTTERRALRKLTQELGSSLKASGFLLDAQGNRIRPKRLPSGFRFSRNKKTPNIIVERRSRRLDTSSEVSAIKQAKRLKSVAPKLKSTSEFRRRR